MGARLQRGNARQGAHERAWNRTCLIAERPRFRPPSFELTALLLALIRQAAHVPKPADALTYGPSGLIDPALVQKLSANFGAAVGAAKNSAHSTTSDASLASSLLDSSSPLFTGLKEEEKPLAIGLARTMQVGLGATLENASLRWTGYEGEPRSPIFTPAHRS